MRTIPLLFCAATLAGCASSSPAEPPLQAPAPVRVMAPPPLSPERPVQPAVVDLPPVEPPRAPRLRISQRSVFGSDRIARWTLENGLTVLYAWDAESSDYSMAVGDLTSEGGADLIGLQRSADGRNPAPSDGIEGAIGLARQHVETLGLPVAQSLVTLHGAIGPEWIEAEIATTLGAVRQGPAVDRGVPTDSVRARVEAGWDDLAALTVVAAVLADRLAPSDRAGFVYDAANGTAELRAESLSLPLAQWLAPGSEGALRDARLRAARSAASGPGVVLALHQLGRLPGRFQPARPPSEVRSLASRIQRIPPDRVNAWLARLATASTQ